jgi:hypothetical protein
MATYQRAYGFSWSRDKIEACGVGKGLEILVSREEGNAPVDAGLGDQRVSDNTFARNRPARCQ